MLDRLSNVAIEDIPNILLTTRGTESERLLIYFSSAPAKRIQGVSKLAPYGQDTIFLRDPRRGWYNLPIKGLARNADELCEQLAERIARYPLDRITMSGSSMGGYAALLFGTMLGVGRIVAVGPQIILRPELIHCPKEPAKYDDLTPLISSKPAHTQIDIWYGAESFLDLFNILRVDPTSTIRLHAIPGAMHNVLDTFKRRGKLEEFFEHVAIGTPFVSLETATSHAREILRAGEAFYFESNYRKTIDILSPIADDANLSAVYFLIGQSHVQVGDLAAARIYLERAVAARHENYDASYHLGLTLDKLGKTRGAARAFARCLDYFPSPHAGRLSKLASAQYRLGLFDEAIINHQRVIELDPRQTKSHFELGQMFMKMGRNEEALSHFQAHAKAIPDFGPTKKHIQALSRQVSVPAENAPLYPAVRVPAPPVAALEAPRAARPRWTEAAVFMRKTFRAVKVFLRLTPSAIISVFELVPMATISL
ncbi:tetratricopeptide repeat protein [Pararhizobium sp. YC-54]|uniref:tetratricopeptide repeat protein n=1 Tax=Pararhizobium sp. YC-54 TaxID=2986920 RepID=UPI0021F7B96E|nr:tetratricopeptide repeat protein [Pararhizobium sp. YC-54]MCV9999938.1 tetratricopeptide repeat protein [Pararhizobium sp. YC-54]